MRHRKCDTDKYRRRMVKQNAKHNQRKREREVQKKVEADRVMAQRLNLIPRRPADVEEIIETEKPPLQAPEPVAPKSEAKMPPAQPVEPPARPLCPLCKKDISEADYRKKNVETIMFNKEPVRVHKTCPTEVNK